MQPRDVPRWLLGVLFVACLAGFAGGIYLEDRQSGKWFDVHPFLGNVLSEVTGLVLSALVALVLIDRAIAISRRRRWERVSEYDIDALCRDIDVVAATLCDAYGVDDGRVSTVLGSGVDGTAMAKPQGQGLIALEEKCCGLDEAIQEARLVRHRLAHESPQALRDEPQGPYGKMQQRLHSYQADDGNVGDALDRIVNVVLPRVLASTDDEKLALAANRLQKVQQQWRDQRARNRQTHDKSFKGTGDSFGNGLSWRMADGKHKQIDSIRDYEFELDAARLVLDATRELYEVLGALRAKRARAWKREVHKARQAVQSGQTC